MKKGCIACIILFCVFTSIYSDNNLPRVAITNFSSDVVPEKTIEELISLLEIELNQTGAFNIIPRIQILRICQSMKIDVNTSEQVDLGMLMGADKLIHGKITKEGTEYTIEVEIIDILTFLNEKYAKLDSHSIIELKNNMVLIANKLADIELPTLGIMDIIPKKKVIKEDAEILMDFLENSIFKSASKKYRVIARNKRDALLKEHEFALSDIADSVEKAIKIGNFLEAQYVVFGNLIKIGIDYYLTLQFVNVNTTEVEGSASDKASDLNKLIDSLPEIVSELF